MSKTVSKLVLASLLAAGLAGTAQADFITGKVTDASGEAPLQGAIVSIDGLNRSATTNRFGEYRLSNIPAGNYTVVVDYVGTDTATSEVNVTASGATLDFALGEDVRYMDNILVVGSSAAQAGAINQQRASDAIISVIDSDGLGNFPDTTVADSLARVAGLSIETDQGEGRYVSIRGINTDLISTSINGVRTPSPEDRRGVLLDGVPSDLLDGIEVQKSLTPDVDADSLGGVINLKTISAFDRDGRFIRAKLEGRYNDITEEISPKATLTYSEVFNNTFGVALSVNYQDLAIESHNNEAGGFGIENGVGFLNDDYEHRWYDLTRERLGLVANFDWRVNESTDLYLRTLFNNYQDDEVRNKFEFRDLDDVEDNGTIGPDGSTTLPLNEVDAEVRVRKETRNIQTIALGGETQTGDWTFEYEASYAFADEQDDDNHDVTFRFEDIQDNFPGDVTFDLSDPQQPRLTGSQSVIDAVYDPANYELDAFEREFSVNEDTEYGARFDVSKDSLLNDIPVVWKAGLKLRDREKTRDENFLFFEPDLNLADFANNTFIDGWRLANPQPTWPDPVLTRSLRDQFNDPTDPDFEEEDSFIDSAVADYTLEERVLAGYGMGTFDFGQLTLVAGVRIEQTDLDLQGVTVNAIDGDNLSSSNREFSDDYTNVLPSLNAKYAFNEKLIGRAAYYAAIVRPAFGEMAPAAAINDDLEVEAGNPNLNPYEADNFDLSLEYYPTELSVISVGVFYKDIENAIFPDRFDREDTESLADFQSRVPIDLGFLGRDDITRVDTFVNVDSSDILGIEFNYVQGLGDLNEALDGFLVSANLTLTDSEATIPNEGDTRNVPFLKQSDTVWNLAVGYDKGPWDLRISANYRGDYLDSLEGEDLDRYTDDRLLVEASAKYRVNDTLQLYIEGKNLTDEPEYYYFGDERRLSQYDEFGATYVFGARLTF
ncbi:TonB-dependent receptor [Hyphomonas sp. FCG-A18]|uniref:TonB-dependent receptor n=1 Tax=Hyphomonas sp. FCG-A18 TaxID=3080019 RepID=UPI002B2E6F18|nr:TonB-dependent receptor [Hyphomonas sp. FCG-A18]